MTDENTALHKAEAEIVELRLTLMNTEACRAEAEKQMHAAEAMHSRVAQQRLEAEQRTAKALEQRDAAREDANSLAAVMNVIAYEPIGDSEASYRTVYEAITEMARAALAAHRAATGKAVTS